VYQRVKEEVIVWLVSQLKPFFLGGGIQKFIAQWTKCIENKGGCMENNAIVQT
jgi:hypothetical protein